MSAASPEPAGLPDGSLVLHIGPHKTGTTTIQAALWAHREELAAQGVAYPGRSQHEMDGAMAVASGRVDPGKDLRLHRGYWLQMVDDLHAEAPRVGVLSSEFYCEASDEGMRTVLDTLGPTTHVVVTLRSVARLLGSQWQQYAQNGRTMSYGDWLTAILDDPEPGGTVTPSFWRRHRHDLLVRRWLDAVGPDRLTVVVADESDQTFLLRSFEGLLGLSAGALSLQDALRNRSLTLDEAEFMRVFNQAWTSAGWSHADYDRFVRFGAVRGLLEHPPQEGDQRLLTPRWAVLRAQEIGRMMAESIAATGVRVIGSLDSLSERVPPSGDNGPVDDIGVEAAARFTAGLVNRLGDVRATADPRADAGPVERQTWTRHRMADLLENPGRGDALRAELAELDARLEHHLPAEVATRSDVLRELGRRVRQRL